MNKRLLTLLLSVVPILTFSQEKGIAQRINEGFQPIADAWGSFIFYSINLGGAIKLPIVVILLIFAGILFTFLFKFVNVKNFFTSIRIVRGEYDSIDPFTADKATVEDVKLKETAGEGEVSHFQALTSALSGTVGLGNIAGVAIAISLGGPGATFWMIIAGILGMSSKFVECTLGVKYRDIGEDGTVYGGPMYYLKKGLADVGKSRLGKVLAVIFAVMVVGGSFGGGNMFQANQAAQQFNAVLGTNTTSAGLLFGIVMAILVAIVIIGGIKRIGNLTEKIVPFMVGVYLIAAIVILTVNFEYIGMAFGQIFEGAFNPKGISGGLLGVLVIGFQRAAFSNEAGVGSAAIAHSAVKTKFPASEGLVALLGPFIDTVVVCTMTALVIIITNSDGGVMTYGVKSPDGVLATSKAFATVIPWFPYILTVAVILFAFSTMLSWSYYGLQGWMFLFGRSKTADYIYKTLFCLFIIVGSSATLGAVTDFGDAMIFAMVVPNLIGLFFLFPKVRAELSKYLKAINRFKKNKLK